MPPPVLTKSSTVRLGQVLPFSLVTENFIVLIWKGLQKLTTSTAAMSPVFWGFFFHFALCHCFSQLFINLFLILRTNELVM